MKFEVLRVNGDVETHETSPGAAMSEIRKAIGAGGLDTVNLRNGRVLVVDDNGYETQCIDHGGGRFELKPTSARKPVNPQATALYHAVCLPGTTHQIVGDAAVVVDADLA